MRKVEMVVLTKSSKFSGYCVAGIDINTKQWIRLTTSNSNTQGALLPKEISYKEGKECQVLDVILITVLEDIGDEIQPENVLIDTSQPIVYRKKYTIEDVLKIHKPETSEYIFGNKYNYITDVAIWKLTSSLILVEVDDLEIKHMKNNDGQIKTKADFEYMFESYQNLSVTDPEFYSVTDGTLYDKAYLVISIGTNYNGKYYKFISKIFV